MTVDRYTKAVLTVIAAALVALAARPWLPESGLLAAMRPEPAMAQTSVPKYEVTVPKAWGKMVAFSNGNLLLEAPDGTMRLVDIDGRAPEYPKIKVQFKYQ
jgi:hypothetical protein